MKEHSGWFIGLGIISSIAMFAFGLMLLLEPVGLKILCIEIFVVCLGLFLRYHTKDEYDYYKLLQKEGDSRFGEKRLNRKIFKYTFFRYAGLIIFIGGLVIFGFDLHSELEKRDEAIEIAKTNICPVFHYKMDEEKCPVCGLEGYPLYILKRMPYWEYQYSFNHTNFNDLTECKVDHMQMAARVCGECGQVKSEIYEFFDENFRCVCGNSLFPKGATKCPMCGRDLKRSVVKITYLDKPISEFNYGIKSWADLFKNESELED